jgi:hypothetical protein
MALTINYSNPGLPVEYVLDSDPTVFGGWGGTNAELASLLMRTDVPSIYRKTGPTSTDWTLQATSVGVGGGINVQEEGVAVPSNPHTTLNFVGTGATATDGGVGVAIITIPGNVIQDEGVPTAGAPHPTLNFVGTGVTATDAGGGVATITIPGNIIQDEGVPTAGAPHPTLNFVGNGVTATDAGAGVATITIPGGVTIQDEGAPIAANPHPTLNFVGGGVTATDAGAGVATITIPGGVTIQDEGAPIAANPHFTLNFVGTGVTAADAGAGVTSITVPTTGALTFGADDIGAGADTQFIALGTNALSFTTDVHQLPLPYANTVKNFFIRHNTANGNGQSVSYTIMKNGVATAITAALATGAIGQGGDITHTVAYVAGDTISLRAVKALAIGAGTLDVQVSIQLG